MNKCKDSFRKRISNSNHNKPSDQHLTTTLLRNRSAFSDDSLTPSPLRLSDVPNISFNNEGRLFCSNPELGRINDDMIVKHHKRELVNKKILSKQNSFSSGKLTTFENEIYQKTLKRSNTVAELAMEDLRRYKRLSLTKVNPHISESLFQLHTLKKENINYQWHKMPNQSHVTLEDFYLARPKKFVRGGQGYLYLVSLDQGSDRSVLKIKKRLNKSNECWQLEQREHLILKNLNHVLIVNLQHVFCSSKTIFLVMEHLNGGCLWDHVAKKGLLCQPYCAYYGACILLALEYLHEKKIVFRDLKSANIVLDWYRRPKLVDFGMAKYLPELESDELKRTVTVTNYQFAGYLAPEIYTCPQNVNLLVDVWGLGYIIMEIQLGFGIYYPMPWDHLADKHLGRNWVLKLPSSCINMTNSIVKLLQLMLRQDPYKRPTFASLKTHSYFKSIHWESLCFQTGPDIDEAIFLRPPRKEKQKNENCRHTTTTKGNKTSKHSNKSSALLFPKDFVTPTFIDNEIKEL